MVYDFRAKTTWKHMLAYDLAMHKKADADDVTHLTVVSFVVFPRQPPVQQTHARSKPANL